MNDTNFVLTKEKDEDLGLDAHKWYGIEDRTEDKGMHDKGTGEPILIRLFEFKVRPDLDKLPLKEEILTNEYIRYLQNLLWGDGLRLVMEPRVVIDKESIKIFAPCQATTGNNFLDKPKLLQEWIQ